MRLCKYLSTHGICSRREAERRILQGLVFVNGVCATLNTPVNETDRVVVSGKDVFASSTSFFVYAFYKPKGIICTFCEKERPNLSDAVCLKERFLYAGRLDRESEGLLILTNDGELVQKLTHPSHDHEKEYIVVLDQEISLKNLESMAKGIFLEDGLTREAKVERISKNSFRICLKEGKNRQIRRMCEFFDRRVINLKRVRIGSLSLNLGVGELKKLGEREIAMLYGNPEGAE